MFLELIKAEPKYRLDQIYRAWFNPDFSSYEQITTLPKSLREQLKSEPWLSVTLKTLQISKLDGTQKALLQLSDGNYIETVLMGRKSKKEKDLRYQEEGEDEGVGEQRFTICISTQVGCPMGCVFCSTGKMGFKRNLTTQEIVDEVRFWILKLHADSPGSRLSNIVLMGQGEPLLNYDNVKQALNIILKYAELGPRQITLSTVGVPAMMEKMVADLEWPPVRFALSLHNPIEEERKQLIPSHQKDFIKFLIDWSKKYHERFSSRTQFIGLEYTIVPGQNDSEKHLKSLIKLASKLGKVRINLIPLNEAAMKKTNADFRVIEHWHERLMECGFTTTIRRSQGQDIAAACGQLALKEDQC